MFLSNKYTKCYYSITDRAKARTLDSTCYVERHHIIPKSLGGDNTKGNIVSLTAREHLICHLLLTKMTTGDAKSKMACAAMRMMFSSKTHQRTPVNSRTYEHIRTIVSESKRGKTGYKHSEESKKKISDSKLGKSRNITPEWRAKIIKSQTGMKKIPCSDERKQKIGDAQRGVPRGAQTDEHRLKVSESKKGKKLQIDPVTGRRYYQQRL
jgi:hypothetical protein